MKTDQAQRETNSDITPAVPLEITADLAAAVDGILREFAEDGELDMALVVDQSGALVTGISSEPEVIVEVISALVAGASGAMRALVGELGETGDLETLLQGEDRVVYLSELSNAFVLVGVCTAPTPVAIIRETANQVRPLLDDLLDEIERPAPDPVQEERPVVHSLRALALERAAARESESVEAQAELGEESLIEIEQVVSTTEEEIVEPVENSSGEEASEEIEQATEEVEVAADESEAAPSLEASEIDAQEEVPTPDPTEVIETLGLDEPEIVIEESAPKVVDSPFEMEEEEEVEEELPEDLSPPAVNPVESIFELEDEEEEMIEESVAAEDQLDQVPEQEELEREGQAAHHSGSRDVMSGNVFEFDEDEAEEETAGSIFEVEEEEAVENEETDEIRVDGEKEEEKSESRSSGPFYF